MCRGNRSKFPTAVINKLLIKTPPSPLSATYTIAPPQEDAGDANEAPMLGPDGKPLSKKQLKKLAKAER